MNELRDCYFSSVQWALMKSLGCRMVIRLNGKLVSRIAKLPSCLHEDEEYIGTALLEDIDCAENVPTEELP